MATTMTPEDDAKNIVYVTINAPDVVSPKINLQSTSLEVDGTTKDSKRHYLLKIEFYESIDVEKSKVHSTDRNIQLVLQKTKKEQEYWPRLLKDKAKVHYLKTDFDRWVDEDEQDAVEEDPMAGMGMGMPGMENLDFSQFAGAGGAGGFGGGDAPLPADSDDEEDDEEVPELGDTSTSKDDMPPLVEDKA